MNSAEQIKAGFETSSGVDQYVTSLNSYNDNQWHYAVVTNNGANVILYIDGVQVATKATSGASPESYRNKTSTEWVLTLVLHQPLTSLLAK